MRSFHICAERYTGKTENFPVCFFYNYLLIFDDIIKNNSEKNQMVAKNIQKQEIYGLRLCSILHKI